MTKAHFRQARVFTYLDTAVEGLPDSCEQALLAYLRCKDLGTPGRRLRPESAGVDEIEKQPDLDVFKFLEANDAFHIGLAELARNQRVYDQLKLVLEYVHRLDLLSTQQDLGWIPHGETVRALRDRKPRRPARQWPSISTCRATAG